MFAPERLFSDPPELPSGETAEVQDTTQTPAYARKDILDALGRLSPEHQMVIIARDVEDLDYDEIAERFGFTRDEVKQRIHEAREEMVIQLRANR